MLYKFLAVLVRLALTIFFRKIEVTGSGKLPKNGPMIIVGNHPNTFMDPILVAFAANQEVHFLANGSIFKTGLAKWFLRKLNMIPVYRKQDAAGLNQRQLNDLSFNACYEFLSKGGVLLIFPEGTSINERNLRPIKSGTARIALGTLAKYPELELKIVPVGINYTNPTRFREAALIQIGEPIHVRDFVAAANEENDEVGLLTSRIEISLRGLIVLTKDKEEDDLVRKIEKVYASTINGRKVLDLKFTNGIVAAIQYYESRDPVFLRSVAAKINIYLENLKMLGLNDFLVEKRRPIEWLKLVRYALYFVAGFPFYCIGLIFNYIPYIIPSKVAAWISRDEEYRAPIMMTSGIFTFSIYYALMVALSWVLTHELLVLVLLLFAMPLSGFFVLQYWKRLANARTNIKFYRLFHGDQSEIDWLAAQRQSIISDLELGRNQFLRKE